jgi:hypothetical protein
MRYTVEQDWMTEAGLRAVVIMADMGHRCGYVGLPANHQHYGKGYDDVPADVHGGLTYADGNRNYPAPSDGLWWFGYDCAHLGDAPAPGSKMAAYRSAGFEDEVHRTLEYCVSECESLAKQLTEVRA